MSEKNTSNSYYAIGLMSGTSLDGLDISYSKFIKSADRWSFELISSKAISYSQDLKIKLKSTVDMSALEITKFDVELGQYFARELETFISEEKITEIDVIGSHGHTVFHQPENGFTLQIGNASWIHEVINRTVVADFRSQDVVMGGQGAPLVPIGDRLLFSEYDFRINLGGFANISFEDNGKTIAYDICAVNTILNVYANKLGFEYDDKGKISKKGKIIQELYDQLEQIEYYKQSPPKSLGVEWNEAVLFPLLQKYDGSKVEDIMHTYTLHVAKQISDSLAGNNTKALISGGGAFNDYLIELIKTQTDSDIIIENKGITDFKEAIIFSFLAVLKIRNEVNCLSEVTGAKEDHSSGLIYSFNMKNTLS